MGIIDGIKITKLEKENSVLKNELARLQNENETLKKQTDKYSELALDKTIEEFQLLIEEVEKQRNEYAQIIREITKIKAEFKSDIDKIKNSVLEV